MLTRRNFLGGVTAGLAAGAAAESGNLWAAGRLAWTGPIGLELYTVRELFAKDPAATLKQVAAAGYKQVEVGPGVKPAALNADLRAAGLTAPSGYFEAPKTADEWKKTIDLGKDYGLHYLVVGDNPKLSTDAWKRRAALFNQCGTLSLAAGMQFCYHAHFREFARADNTCGYDIMLTRCDAKLLKMEMDVFWATYAGVDPVSYFERYPGRFPLLHIKDLKKGYKGSTTDDPPDNGPNPFMPVGQGSIDWQKIFAHAGQAGAKHIFVEQDRCDVPPLEAIKISSDYLKNLRLA
ncbi:MAG: sugar phosphate isomerase/epimerase family protein [Terriglobia bacterium]